MIAATFLAIFFVPLFFRLITDRRVKESRTKDELMHEVEHARAIAHKEAPHTPGHPPRGIVGDGL
jgi:multidrug efflux pump